MATREDAVTWMNNERLNLHAAAGYAASHNRPGHAIAIPAAMHGYLRSHGHWDQALSLHRAALQAARHAGDRLAEAGALNHLGDMQYLAGTIQWPPPASPGRWSSTAASVTGSGRQAP